MTKLKKLPKRILQRIEARNLLTEIVEWSTLKQPRNWAFRGQSKDWELKPSIGRRKKAVPPEQEIHLLNEFRRKAEFYLPNKAPKNDWEWLSLGQHHGLPTRLLDWSTNPMVACFLACQPSKTGGKDDGYIYSVSFNDFETLPLEHTKASSPFDIDEISILYPPSIAARIHRQSGLFTVHPTPSEALEVDNGDNIFVIKESLKVDILHLLSGLGVDDESLMSDLDGLSKSLKWRHETFGVKV